MADTSVPGDGSGSIGSTSAISMSPWLVSAH
jgi:hypothetical protein